MNDSTTSSTGDRSDDLETQLRAELAAVGTEVGAPTVRVADLAHLGRREKRRRASGAVVGGVAAVLVVGLGIAAITGPPSDDEPAGPGPAISTRSPLTPPTAAPASLDALPDGPATRLPWWEDGRLHVDGITLPIAMKPSLLTRGGTTVVSDAATGTVRYVVRDGEAAEGRAITGRPGGISPDGSLVVLTSDTALVAYDAATETVSSTLEVEVSEGEVLDVVGALDDHRVVYDVVDLSKGDITGGVYLWDVDSGTSTPISVPGGPSALQGVDQRPDALSWLDDDGVTGVQATVADDGSLTPVATSDYAFGRWSPDGSVVAWRYSLPIVVQAPARDGFGPTELPLPDGPDYSIVGWESESDLLLAGADGADTTFVRCSVPDLVCERVADGPASTPVLADS